jgi:hypothetical protein
MWNNNQPHNVHPNTIPTNQIDLNIHNDDFPVPQSKNQQQPHYQKPHKVGRPQQEFLKII